MKKLKWILCLIVFCAICISFAQYIQVLTATPRGIWHELLRIQQDKRNVDLLIKVRDQFEQPVADYQFKLLLITTRWFFWAFPLSSYVEKPFILRTNQAGEARLRLSLQRASKLRFEMLDTSAYVFPRDKILDGAARFEDKPSGQINLPAEDNHGLEELVIHVIKHQPREDYAFCGMLNWVRQPFANENKIGLNLDKGGSCVSTSCDLTITARNIPAFLSNPKSGWSMMIECGPELEIAEVPREVVTNAPECGYKKMIRISSIMDFGKPVNVFARRLNGQRYYLLRVEVVIEKREGIRAIVTGKYNPRGSTNFYGEVIAAW